ncbi:hypothetical protein E2P81_ATG10630 [Venturia nashicola]|nr:hypothetical protein E2P81_ATG10630 [Venturia nashicola]
MLGKLRLAALLHQYQILGDIIDSPADLNDAGSVGTALHMSMLRHSVFDIQWRHRELDDIDSPRDRDHVSSLTVKTLVDLGADMNVKFPLFDGREVPTALIACMTGHHTEAFTAGALLDGITADWLYMNRWKVDLEDIASMFPIDVKEVAECDRPAVIRLLQKLGQSLEIADSRLTLEGASVADEQKEVLPGYVRVLDEACKDDDLLIVRWFFEYSKLSVDHLIGGETALHKACFWSSVSVAEYLVVNGAQINKLSTKGDRPLGCLLRRGGNLVPSTQTIMNSLLGAGANINSLDKDNNSGLLCWARMSYSNEWRAQLQDILNIILSSEADLSGVNDGGESVWHVLAANKHGHCLSEMLKATMSQRDIRATFDTLDKTGCTALHTATSNCHGQMMQFLIGLGSSPTKRTLEGRTILDLASANLDRSHIPFRIALDAGCHSLSKEPQNCLSRDTTPGPIWDIICIGDLDRLKSFVAAGGNPELRFQACGCTPMIIALMWRQPAVVDYLMSLGVGLKVTFCQSHFPEGCSTLSLLASQDLMFQQLQATFTSTENFVMQEFDHMIHSAAANGNVKALEFMLHEKRRVQCVKITRHRNTPVFGFDFAGNRWMWTDGTALHTAVRVGQSECAQVLLKHGYDPDAHNFAGVPCSHLAAYLGNVQLLEQLLSHGGTVDARDGDMVTTIGSAARRGHLQVLHLLIQRGADLCVKDHEGRTLFQIATESGNRAVFFSLLEAGLKPTPEDLCKWFNSGYRQICMVKDFMEQLLLMPELLVYTSHRPEAKALLTLVTPHYRKVNLTSGCRHTRFRITSLYRAATAGWLKAVKLLHSADAMLNLEGGPEGTPLMGACRTGRLDVVKHLVRNGAVLSYSKSGVQFNAFTKAASYPKIQRWLLVERFTEQRTIVAGDSGVEQKVDIEPEDTCTYADDIADVTLDLVLEDDVEQYLESKNWFLPMRRFVDNGAGAFERVPIMPKEFARYRPSDLKIFRA